MPRKPSKTSRAAKNINQSMGQVLGYNNVLQPPGTQPFSVYNTDEDT